MWEERKKRQINLVILEMAIGSGKSFFSSILQWLQWKELICKYNPHEYFRLDPDSKIAFICLSKTHDQARKITFDYVQARFKSGFNKDYFPPNDRKKSELEIKRSNTLIFPGTSSEASALGYNVYGANIDEAANLDIVEDSKKATIGDVYDPAEEIFNATYQRMKSRFVDPITGKVPGFIVMMSSPVHPDDFMERKIREAESGEATDIFWRRAKLWEAKPKWFFPRGKTFLFDTETLEIIDNKKLKLLKQDPKVDVETRIERPPVELKQEYKINPERVIRDYSCIPMDAISPFFRNKDAIYKAFYKNIKNPFNEDTCAFDEDFYCEEPENAPFRYMHIDLAKSGDRCGISMCHVSGTKMVKRINKITNKFITEEIELPIITFDFIGGIQGSKGSNIMIGDVKDLIYDLRKRGFPIELVTFDQWQSLYIIQTLREDNFIVGELSIDRTHRRIIVDYSEDDFYKKVSTDKHYIAPQSDLRDGLYEERVILPYHELAIQELKWAEYDVKKNKIDHPPNKSIDIEQSIAGSYFNCLNNEAENYGMVEEQKPAKDTEDKDYYENIEKEQEVLNKKMKESNEDPYYTRHNFEDNLFDRGDL